MPSQAIWDCAARPELKNILRKLEGRFGPALMQIPSDPEWLTVRVAGFTELCLLQTLEREKDQFFGDQLARFQILSEQTGKSPGVSIRYLPDALSVSKAYSGFWFY